MDASSESVTSMPSSDRGRLRAARRAAVAATLSSYLLPLPGVWAWASNTPQPPGFASARDLATAFLVLALALLISLPALIPNVLALWCLRGEPQKKRLARAAAAGWAGFAMGLLFGLMFVLTVRKEESLEEDWGFVALSALFVLAQGALGLIANGLIRSVPAKPGESGRTLGAATMAGSILYCGLFGIALQLSSNLWRRCPTRETSTPVGGLRTLNTAMVTYASTYGGFPPGLRFLGPPAAGTAPGCTTAGLTDDRLAEGERAGYVFQYTVGPPTREAPTAGCPRGADTYTLSARPVRYGRCDQWSYFTDESGVIRSTMENRPATAQDKPIY